MPAEKRKKKIKMESHRCPVCNEVIDKWAKLCPSCRQVIRSTLLSRNYRPIVFVLVMINTALIVFLVGYIWVYGLEDSKTRSYGNTEPGKPAVEQSARIFSSP
ncbi:MAG: hypothetical protein JXQ83_00490 [Candidatus Glassbacteria bacterium]|nr:hypothetical protein [Candidatus Glassbacteria bacterium]